MSDRNVLVGPDGVTPLRRPPMQMTPADTPGAGLKNPASWSLAQFGPGPAPASYPLGGEPRQQDYRPGWNLPTPPGEGRILPYSVARSVADQYDILRSAIEIRKNEMAMLKWDIVPHPRYRGKRLRATMAEKLAKKADDVRLFFEAPEAYMSKGRGGAWRRVPKVSYGAWLKALLEDYFVIGIESIYPRPKLNGDLLRFERVDSATVKPLLDDGGRTPDPPAPAYSIWNKGAYRKHFSMDQFVFATDNLRNQSAYPLSHVERLAMNINWALRYNSWNTAFFTDGSLPEMVMEAPEGWTAEQIQELNNWWDDVMRGDPAALRRLKFIPPGSKPHMLKSFTFDYKVALWIATVTAIVMDVAPSELGLSPIASEGLGGSGHAEAQAKAHRRKSLTPLATWQAQIFTGLIQRYWGTDDLVFSYVELMDQDELESSEADAQAIQSGIKSLDQVLMERGEDPVGVDRIMVLPGGSVLGLPDLQRISKEGTGYGTTPAPGAQDKQDDKPAGDGGEQDGAQEADDPDTGNEDPQTGGDSEPKGKQAAEKATLTKAAQDDLSKWRTKAVRRFADGRKLPLEFESTALPEAVKSLVAERLQGARTLEAVKAAFTVTPEDAAQAEEQAAKEAVQTVIDKDYAQLPKGWADAYRWRKQRVHLHDIDAARRPSKRNLDKLKALGDALDNGEKLPPLIVLAEGDGYSMFDGYHRWLALDKAGRQLHDAYIGTPIWQDLYKPGGNAFEQERSEKAATSDDMLRALLDYRTQALGDVGKGANPAERPFADAALPAQVSDVLRARLVKAATADGVAAVFAKVTADVVKGSFDSNAVRHNTSLPAPIQHRPADGYDPERPTKSQEAAMIALLMGIYDDDILPRLQKPQGAAGVAAQAPMTRVDLQNALRMGEAEIAKLSDAIYDLKVSAYRDGINEQLRALGIDPVNTINDPMTLQKMRTDAENVARQVAQTYNKDLGNAVNRLNKELPEGRGAQERADLLRDKLTQWVKDRAEWKAEQVAITESNDPFNRAVMDFHQKNDLTDMEFEVTPDLCHCMGCWNLVDGSPYTFSQALIVAKMLPLHPRCWHKVVPLTLGGVDPQRIHWKGGSPHGEHRK